MKNFKKLSRQAQKEIFGQGGTVGEGTIGGPAIPFCKSDADCAPGSCCSYSVWMCFIPKPEFQCATSTPPGVS